jgi:plastocyanin
MLVAIGGCGGGNRHAAVKTHAVPKPAVASGKATTLRVSAVPGLRFSKKRLTAPAGRVTIVMRNDDHEPTLPSNFTAHNITFKEDVRLSGGLRALPGETSKVSAVLKAGVYHYQCVLSGHNLGGMVGTLVVHRP